MGLFDWLRAPRAEAPMPATQKALSAPTRAIAGMGGRLSQDTLTTALSLRTPVLVAPNDFEAEWRTLNLDSTSLSRQSPTKLMEMLADLSPEVSRALWDFLRQCNAGWTCEVFRPGGETPDERARAVLTAFLDRLDDLYGSVDVVFNRLFFAAFLRGAFFAELVLDEAGREAVDLATPDPMTVRFRRVGDPVRGQVWQMGQWQGGTFTVFDRPTIRYAPVDPFPGSPYGRPLAAPALFASLFLLGLLHDLRRVVAQQGYPRLDVEIILERLKELMPANLEHDAAAQEAWVAAVVAEVSGVYEGLEPDDAYVHLDVTKINRPVGAVDSSSLGAIDGLIEGLERMAVRALKSVPFLMGTVESTTETQSNRQWEAHLQSIKSVQHICESMLERLFGLALQAQGITAVVQLRFAENRASEALRDQQARQLRNQNIAYEYQMGWIGQDEAAQEAVGHAPDLPDPRVLPSTLAPYDQAADDAGVAREQGENRGVGGRRAPAEKVRPEGAALPDVPEPILRDRDIAAALDEWDATMPERYRTMLDAEVAE